MLIDINKFQGAVNRFNEKFNVNFSLEQYQLDLFRKDFGEEPFDINDPDLTLPNSGKQQTCFRKYINKLYEEAAYNALLKGEAKEDLFSLDMMQSFYKDILYPYYKETLEANENDREPTDPLADSDWQNLLWVKDAASPAILDNPVNFFAYRYKNGTLTAEEMQNHVNNMNVPNISTEQFLNAFRYAEALRETNKERSFLWKVMHPVLNYREKRLASQIEKRAAALIKENNSAIRSEGLPLYESKTLDWYKKNLRSEKCLEMAKNRLNDKINAIVAEEDIDDIKFEADKKDPVIQRLANRDMLSVKYTPDIYKLGEEYRELHAIAEAIKNGQHSEEIQAIAEKNLKRINEVARVYNEQGLAEAIAYINDKKYAEWKNEDELLADILNRDEEYKPDDVTINIREKAQPKERLANKDLLSVHYYPTFENIERDYRELNAMFEDTNIMHGAYGKRTVEIINKNYARISGIKIAVEEKLSQNVGDDQAARRLIEDAKNEHWIPYDNKMASKWKYKHYKPKDVIVKIVDQPENEGQLDAPDEANNANPMLQNEQLGGNSHVELENNARDAQRSESAEEFVFDEEIDEMVEDPDEKFEKWLAGDGRERIEVDLNESQDEIDEPKRENDSKSLSRESVL